LLQTGDSGTDPFHQADTLVAWDERDGGLDRPVSVCSMDVGVTKARGLDLDENLTYARIRLCDVL
jgi:hypothetical protein